MTVEYVDSLPDTIRVGPYDVRIEKADDLDDDWGNYDKLVIYVVRKHPSKIHAADTFIHELCHCLWAIHGLGDTCAEERAVHAFSIGLTQIYRDNPWCFEWIMQAYD